jgi:hypothetical protein
MIWNNKKLEEGGRNESPFKSLLPCPLITQTELPLNSSCPKYSLLDGCWKFPFLHELLKDPIIIIIITGVKNQSSGGFETHSLPPLA